MHRNTCRVAKPCLWRYVFKANAVVVAARGLHAEGAEPAGAGVLRDAAGAGRGGPARQPDHARYAHHGRGRQRNGHQVSGGRAGSWSRRAAGAPQ